MKAVITGARGFVGRNLVPLLSKSGLELLLVGRDARTVGEAFPGYQTCDYEALPRLAEGADLLVHLATANNDSGLDEVRFAEANVDLLVRTAQAAAQAGVPRFINISSVHALQNGATPYARTKREGARRLEATTGIASTTLFLPMVYGDEWGGRLKVLNRLPKPVARSLFQVLAALKPTVRIERLAEAIVADAHSPGETLIISDTQARNIVFQATKRLIDILFAVGILVVFWWLLALVWLAIRLHSPGPGLFSQVRVGRGGRPFVCYKFRTMKQGTTQAGTHQVSAAAVTDGLGNLLRRTKIDELPQVWNILKNEISLIGPRPCLPVQTELVEARRIRGVLDIMPGITGLAQVEGIDMSDPERLARRDAEYVALQSLVLDLKILLATATGKGQGDKVAAAS